MVLRERRGGFGGGVGGYSSSPSEVYTGWRVESGGVRASFSSSVGAWGFRGWGLLMKDDWSGSGLSGISAVSLADTEWF